MRQVHAVLKALLVTGSAARVKDEDLKLDFLFPDLKQALPQQHSEPEPGFKPCEIKVPLLVSSVNKRSAHNLPPPSLSPPLVPFSVALAHTSLSCSLPLAPLPLSGLLWEICPLNALFGPPSFSPFPHFLPVYLRNLPFFCYISCYIFVPSVKASESWGGGGVDKKGNCPDSRRNTGKKQVRKESVPPTVKAFGSSHKPHSESLYLPLIRLASP